MIRFVERKWWYFGLSLLLIVPGVIFLAIPFTEAMRLFTQS